jgi:hypothetical protein
MSLAARIYRERRKVALPLIAFLLGNVAVFVLAVLPLRRAVTSAESESIDVTLRLHQARLAEKNALDLRGRSEQADKDLRKFYAEILPRDFAGARSQVVYWSQRTADAMNLALRSGEFGQEFVEDSRLVKVTGRITLSGQYANIRRFLYALETAEEFIIVENVVLEQPTQTAQQGTSAGVGVALELATYFVSGPEERR